MHFVLFKNQFINYKNTDRPIFDRYYCGFIHSLADADANFQKLAKVSTKFASTSKTLRNANIQIFLYNFSFAKWGC